MTFPFRADTRPSPKLQLFGREGRLLLPDGRALSFMEFGPPNGLPAFAFHGTPGSRFMFKLTEPYAERLGLRIIAPERPGFGRSSFQKRRTLAGWAADVQALADALAIPRFAVAGVSGGGPYAAACAALLPERVLAAALISPIGPCVPPEGASRIGSAHHTAFRMLPKSRLWMMGAFSLGRLAFLRAPLAVFGLLLGRATASDFKILSRQEVRINLLEGVGEGFRPGIRGMMQEMRIFSRLWNIPFDAIRAPCFLWQGTADRNVPAAAAFRLAELIPGCTVSRLEGAGHYWIFDHIEEVLRTVKASAEAALAAQAPGDRAGRGCALPLGANVFTGERAAQAALPPS
jgi:pimeloyl-ACP methyl ester carboxylesterase